MWSIPDNSDCSNAGSAARGDYRADVDELLDTYTNMVYKIALIHMKHPSDADDIFQEVFLRLMKYAHTLQSEAHAKAWLIRVTVNCCKKHFLSAWFRNTAPLEDTQPAAGLNHEHRELYEAVGTLPRDQRVVVHLYYYEGYSVEEIAGILGRKESTVKSQLFRARNALREKLRGDFDLG